MYRLTIETVLESLKGLFRNIVKGNAFLLRTVNKASSKKPDAKISCGEVSEEQQIE